MRASLKPRTKFHRVHGRLRLKGNLIPRSSISAMGKTRRFTYLKIPRDGPTKPSRLFYIRIINSMWPSARTDRLRKRKTRK